MKKHKILLAALDRATDDMKNIISKPDLSQRDAYVMISKIGVYTSAIAEAVEKNDTEQAEAFLGMSTDEIIEVLSGKTKQELTDEIFAGAKKIVVDTSGAQTVEDVLNEITSAVKQALGEKL